MSTKPFDINKAIKGEKVILDSEPDDNIEYVFTLSHVLRAAQDKKHLFKGMSKSGLEWLMLSDNIGNVVACHNGRSAGALKMAPKKKTVWINAWEDDMGQLVTSHHPHASFNEARNSPVCNDSKYIGTFPIEIEE